VRLKKYEVKAIKTTFKEIFKNGDIYLFGSRVDDSKKGGDIDLYISIPDKKDLVSKKIDFLVKLKRKIGEQKIDVVLDYKENRLIDKIAKQGIKL
jgi:predicted nucleotidyltransferase